MAGSSAAGSPAGGSSVAGSPAGGSSVAGSPAGGSSAGVSTAGDSTAGVRAVVFDLDGTLVQTRIASWEVFEPINRRHGLGVDTPELYFELFRGNLFASIRERCRDAEHARSVTADLLAALRSSYSPPLVPGMHAVVRRLAAEFPLAVMSSNAMEVLRRVLVDNDLAYCFAHVFGGDVAPNKRTALRTFLADTGSGYGRRCSADYDEAGEGDRPDRATTVLVTDTAGDVGDAVAVGVRVVGVSWGMHTAAELTDAGAEFVALWPQEILSHLLGDAAAHEPTGACAIPMIPAVSDPARGCGGSCCSVGGAGVSANPGDASAMAPGGACETSGEIRRRRRRDAARTHASHDVASQTRPNHSQPDRRSRSDRSHDLPDPVLEAMRRICRSP